MDFGKIIKDMDKVNINMVMEIDLKVILFKVKELDKVNIYGVIIKLLKVIGTIIIMLLNRII